jgi:competence transcription factor ComK
MTKITVERTYDETDCETCGISYEEGAKITFENGKTIDLRPSAHCYNGQGYTDEDIMRTILHELGHELVVV